MFLLFCDFFFFPIDLGCVFEACEFVVDDLVYDGMFELYSSLVWCLCVCVLVSILGVCYALGIVVPALRGFFALRLRKG